MRADLSGDIDLDGFLYDPYVLEMENFVEPLLFENECFSQTPWKSDAKYDYLASVAPDPQCMDFPFVLQDGHSQKIESFSTTGEGVRTVMIKHIPCRCTRNEILDVVAELGFAGTYEFFHLPTKRGQHNFGYAFISFYSSSLATAFRSAMTGFTFPSRKSSKEVCVVPARIQGFTGTVGQHTRRGKRHVQWLQQLAEPLPMDVPTNTYVLHL